MTEEKTAWSEKNDTVGKTAIIIGGGSKARHLDVNLLNDPAVEVWGFNAIRYEWIRRWDRMFNIHRYQLLLDYGWPVEKDARWAAENPKVPFYTADKWPDGRMARAQIFPRDDMNYMPRHDYHCNSFDWLIALAVHWRFREVHLHGCGLTTEGMMEQMSARACVEHWCGYAEGRGVKIVCAPDTNLFCATHVVLSDRVYGYDDSPAFEDRRSTAPKGAPYRYDD